MSKKVIKVGNLIHRQAGLPSETSVQAGPVFVNTSAGGDVLGGLFISRSPLLCSPPPAGGEFSKSDNELIQEFPSLSRCIWRDGEGLGMGQGWGKVES